jgi:hypothetical protein
MQNIDKILDEMILQFKEWDGQLMRMKMSDNYILLSHRAKMNLISCKDHAWHRKNDNFDETFELCWVARHFLKIEFDKYVKIVAKKIPNSEKAVERMTVLYNKLKPIMTKVYDILPEELRD